jgi:hypothetical protein
MLLRKIAIQGLLVCSLIAIGCRHEAATGGGMIPTATSCSVNWSAWAQTDYSGLEYRTMCDPSGTDIATDIQFGNTSAAVTFQWTVTVDNGWNYPGSGNVMLGAGTPDNPTMSSGIKYPGHAAPQSVHAAPQISGGPMAMKSSGPGGSCTADWSTPVQQTADDENISYQFRCTAPAGTSLTSDIQYMNSGKVEDTIDPLVILDSGTSSAGDEMKIPAGGTSEIEHFPGHAAPQVVYAHGGQQVRNMMMKLKSQSPNMKMKH